MISQCSAIEHAVVDLPKIPAMDTAPQIG